MTSRINASRAMSGVEQGYAQIEKDELAACACNRYSNFLIGKPFHKELPINISSVLGQNTLNEYCLPPIMQWFRMRVMRFRYSILHAPGKDLVTVGTLSQAPRVESQ